MDKQILLITFTSLFITACAPGPYTGPGPKLNLTNQTERETEYKKFKFRERSLFFTSPNILTMGENQEYFRNSKMNQMIQDVSPKAWNSFETADNLSRLGLYSFLAGLGSFGGMFLTKGKTNDIFFFSGMGLMAASISFNFTGAGFVYSGVRQYNKDLRENFHISSGD